MKTRDLASGLALRLTLLIALMLCLLMPAIIKVVERQSIADELQLLKYQGQNVSAGQERRFAKIRVVEARAITLMQTHLATPDTRDALKAVDADYPLAGDGTRRSRAGLFDGERHASGPILQGIAGYIRNGRDLSPERARRLLAASETLRRMGEGLKPELTSLYFFTPQNDVLIFAPDRPDKLLFYRRDAPADLDFQTQVISRIATPQVNPKREMLCTGLEPANYDPTGKTWTTGCILPFDIDGQHVGAWGVSLPLHELFSSGIGKVRPGTAIIIVSARGQLIFDAGYTRQSDSTTAEYLNLAKTSDPRLQALGRFLAVPGGRIDFAGFIPELGAYATVTEVPTPGWRVISLRSEALIIAPANYAAKLMIIVALVFGLGTIAALRWLVKDQVGRPLQALTSRAEAIAALSSPTQTTALPGKGIANEIQRLNASFDTLEASVSAERQRLQQSFDLLARNIENYGIFMLDREGRIVNWNAGAERLTGYRAVEVLGRSSSLLLPAGDHSGPDPVAAATTEGWRVRRDGSRFWAEILTEPVADEHGEWVGRATIVRDITEERAQALRLQESLRLLNLAENAARLGHWRLQIDDDTLFWSPAMYEIRGIAPGTPMTQKLGFVGYDRSEVQRFRTLLADLLQNPREARLTTWFTHADGHRRDVEVRVFVETEPSGKANAIFGIMRDITEAKQAATDLIAARDAATAAADARTDLLATMSHEIRTPMTGIIGMLELLQDQGGVLPPGMSITGLAQSARTMMTVLDDALDHSRLEGGKIELEAIPFDVGDLASDTAALFTGIAAAKATVIKIDRPHPLPAVGDPSRLQQILSNLIGNAVKFTANGEIRITCSTRQNGMTRIMIEDTGIGIDPSQLPSLFEAYRQGDRNISRKFGGSGLGLAISRRLANAMGGDIEAASTPGKGSRFWVDVPLARAVDVRAVDVRPEVEIAPVHLMMPDGSRPHILLGEDIEATRQIAEAHLVALGCRVTAVANGADALAAILKASPDAVLIDNRMPVLDGSTAIRLVRMLPGTAGRLPILAFTASASGSEGAAMRAAGCDAMVSKPFERKHLASTLMPLLNRPQAAAVEPSASLREMLLALPASMRVRVAENARRDAVESAGKLAAALAAHDGIAAAAALHALAGLSAMIGADELSRLTRFGEATLAALAPQDCLWMGDAIVACAMRLQSAIDIAMAAPGETMTIEPTGGAN